MSTILFVDDDRSIREMLGVFFKEWGVMLTALPSALDAIHYLTTDVETKLLLTDIIMPEMDGIELAEYVRKHYPQIEVIALTGTDRVINNETGLFREILHKPFEVAKLRALAFEFSPKAVPKA